MLMLIFGCINTSCEKLIDVDPPLTQIPIERIFNSDATATSAITGMYLTMLNSENFASGSNYSISALSSLSSDDFNWLGDDLETIQIASNNINPNNAYVLRLWTTAYKTIFQANSAIEGLNGSQGVTSNLKNQLLGEAYFVRAFCHFHLVNLFGDVPLIISTDYKINTLSPRISEAQVRTKIIDDLLMAQQLMGDSYPSADRVRPNKAVANALLARAYLYLNNWANAESQASLLINNTAYQLESDLNNTFTATSREAIWQLQPYAPYINTWEGVHFISGSGEVSKYKLTDNLIASFANGDKRKANWISSVDFQNQPIYYAYKYKVQYSSNPGEYSMVLRLAEQYLIRAEARTQLNKLSEAISDVDEIRMRAGLPLLQTINPNISKSDLLLAIEKERRNEFFTEWGHRWFDLKRTNKITDVLSVTKAGWSSSDALYPIPLMELKRNSKLGNQNPGY
jgi:hypothetical protein